jgi:L-seryl-tRNA(Ser) seleniumtransferase
LSQIGSGALPVENIPSFALRISPRSGEDAQLRELAKSLRLTPVPILGRLHKGCLWLDLRCLEDDKALLAQLEMLAP